MTLKKRVAAMMSVAALLSMVFSGSQSLASSSLIKEQNITPPQTPNGKIFTAFGEHVRLEATPKGFQLHGWGFKNNAEFDVLTFSAEAEWDPAISIYPAITWKGTHFTTLVKLTKPDDYQGNVGFITTNPKGGVGKPFYYQMIVPQYGSSNLAFTTTSMPPAHIGDHYSFRFLVKGGTPPYTFYLVYNSVKGLVLTRAGRNAGLFSGIPVQQAIGGWHYVPVIVWDKMHHATYVVCNLSLSS
jgi:hypothetical protein